MKAYKISCQDPDHGADILFAAKSKDLRGSRTDMCDCPYIELSVKRASEFDKYSPGPVTPQQCMDEGWYWLCCRCEAHVCNDAVRIVIETDHVFCGRECLEKELESVEKYYGQEIHESMRTFRDACRKYLTENPVSAERSSAAASEL